MTAYADLQTALATINTVVQKATVDLFSNPQAGVFLRFTEKMTSGSDLNQLVQPGAGPKMRQWTGAKQFKTFRAYAQTHQTVPFEASMRLTRREVQYDKSGMVGKKISNFLSDQIDAYDRISFAQLIATPTGLDGVALFSASHPWATEAGGTQGNTGTTAMSLAAVTATRNAGMALTYENGEYMGINYDTIMCGPALTQRAREIAEANDRVLKIDASGAEATASVVTSSTMQNMWQGAFTVVENPRLVGTYANYWYMIDSTFAGGQRPLILIESDSMHVTAMDQPTSDNAFFREEYLCSVTADLIVAPFAWMSIYRHVV